MKVQTTLWVLLAGIAAAAADCAPTLAVAESADCCTCLSETTVDGAEADLLSGNCLPDDEETTRGINSAEEQACAAGAGETFQNPDHAVFAEAPCLISPHPCAQTCADANDAGARFEPPSTS